MPTMNAMPTATAADRFVSRVTDLLEETETRL